MKQQWTAFVQMARPEEAEIRSMLSSDPDFRIWRNAHYQVVESRIYARSESGQKSAHYITQLSIKRNDRLAIHDWRDLQRIKNELAGAEALAIEVYPPESKLVDTANQYFLWVMPPHWVDPIFGFIFQERVVTEAPLGNSRQRPWAAADRPKDLQTNEQVDAWYKSWSEKQRSYAGGKK